MFRLHKVSENKFVSRHERDLKAAISSVDFRADGAAAPNSSCFLVKLFSC